LRRNESEERERREKVREREREEGRMATFFHFKIYDSDCISILYCV
jgi:hypothetical protein